MTNFLSDEKTLLLSLLDPYSPLLPAEIREGWTDQDLVYKTSRNYFYDLHKKREKIIGSEKQESDNPKITVAHPVPGVSTRLRRRLGANFGWGHLILTKFWE